MHNLKEWIESMIRFKLGRKTHERTGNKTERLTDSNLTVILVDYIHA